MVDALTGGGDVTAYELPANKVDDLPTLLGTAEDPLSGDATASVLFDELVELANSREKTDKNDEVVLSSEAFFSLMEETGMGPFSNAEQRLFHNALTSVKDNRGDVSDINEEGISGDTSIVTLSELNVLVDLGILAIGSGPDTDVYVPGGPEKILKDVDISPLSEGGYNLLSKEMTVEYERSQEIKYGNEQDVAFDVVTEDSFNTGMWTYFGGNDYVVNDVPLFEMFQQFALSAGGELTSDGSVSFEFPYDFADNPGKNPAYDNIADALAGFFSGSEVNSVKPAPYVNDDPSAPDRNGYVFWDFE